MKWNKHLSLSLPLFILAQTALGSTPNRWISVSGDCLRSVSPDRSSVVLTADVLSPTPQESSKKATQIYEQLRNSVKKLAVKDLELQTTEYRLDEDVSWENNKKVSKGYRARMGLKIATSQRDRMGEIFLLGGEAGVKDVGQLSTFVSREKLKSEEEACLSEAVKNARQKADTLAKAAGTEVTSVININEANTQVPNPISFQAAMMSDMPGSAGGASPKRSAPSAGIEAQNEKISVTVTVNFALK